MYRIYLIFLNPKLRVMKLTDRTMASVIGVLLTISTILLILHSTVAPPHVITRENIYGVIPGDVTSFATERNIHRACSTSAVFQGMHSAAVSRRFYPCT